MTGAFAAHGFSARGTETGQHQIGGSFIHSSLPFRRTGGRDRGRVFSPTGKQGFDMKKHIIGNIILPLALAAVLACGFFFISGGSLGTAVVGIKSFLGIRSPGGTTSAMPGGEPSSGEVRVLLAAPEGLTVLSPNPVSAAQGSPVSFDISVRDGYVVEALPEGWTMEDGKVSTPAAYFSSTAVPKVRKLDVYLLTVRVSDGGDGAGEAAGRASLSSSECTEGDPVSLNATAGDHFAFAGWSLGTPACEGGLIFSEDSETVFYPESGSVLIANFRRVSCPVTVEESEGIDFITPREVTVLRGGTCFFMFTLKEGYSIDEIPEGTVLTDGKLTVRNIMAPTVLKIRTRRLASYRVDVILTDTQGGSVAREPASEFVWEGGEMTLTAEPADGYVFEGFSLDRPLSEGGTPLGNAESPALTHTLIPEGNLTVYANFAVKRYTVTVETDPGVSLSGENTLSVVSGSDAEFGFTVDRGYTLVGVEGEGASIEGNLLRVSDVRSDITVKIGAKPLSAYTFTLINSAEVLGKASSNPGNGYYYGGTTITLTAEDGIGKFKGWSTGGTLDSGGRLLSSAKQYRITLGSTLKVWANFADPSDDLTVGLTQWGIVYVPNGGINRSAGDGSVYTVRTTHAYTYSENPSKSENPHRCPNAQIDNGQFYRNGYVLTGYNTKPDGSGRFYAPGWNIVMPEDGKITLYCMWEKETPASAFTYTKTSSEVTIKLYSGNDSKVVIPLTIDGVKVTSIASSAFRSLPNLKELVISRNVKTISTSAVYSCPLLETVRITDAVTSMSDSWYSSCPSFKALIISAQRMPTYQSGRNGTYSVKFEWMMTAPGNRIVVMSGSNSAYGVNAPMLEKLLAAKGLNYSVINYGQNASCCQAVFIEACSKFMHEGDILLVAPEMNKRQYGDTEWYEGTQWQMVEGAYEIVSYIDISHYKKVFSTFAAFNVAAAKRSAQTYETFTTDSVNAWGDYSLTKTGATSDWKKTLDSYDAAGGKGSVKFSSSVSYITNATYRNEINRVYDLCAAKGAKVLYTFPTIVKTCLTVEAQTAGSADHTAIMNAVDTYLHVTRISTPDTYIMDRQYSYNSNYHLNTAGQTIRTQRLAADIAAYFNK